MVMEPKEYAEEVIEHPLLIIWEYDWILKAFGNHKKSLINETFKTLHGGRFELILINGVK